ncbi:acyclic terpene utilization AtuA family protein [Paenibacillus albiflavus]|uniref:Acyclic terpene utilization AtuA family protein n=1 Tax=Paenibacillus albiflavus TaxID=2545760 RepID=A0A4R4EAE7_9BACL|nr:acyclic terpene utilization AtuA family protein [Paenibacillus albiflavus]TCZ76609.1 acyclic terpene utilization AtuA family protein [Paenibacillus albiflavus]
MTKEEFKILAPCGMLGYGFPKSSFRNGMACSPDAIVVDAGSTDAGPHKLGAGTAIVSKQACKKDLELMITAGVEAKIPVIIGSAGGSGAKVHVEWTRAIIMEILQEHHIHDVKVATIWADIPHEAVEAKLAVGECEPLGLSVKSLTADRLAATTSIVAQMGHEPILKALQEGADIIICGRAYDPSPFAAVAMHNGCGTALSYHLGKILECAALSADPGTTKDCMLGILKKDSFIVKPLNESRKCTTISVAAHTFYEKDHPYILHGPGLVLNLEHCTFTDLGDGSVEVHGSQVEETPVYKIKLEGAMKVAYRTFVVAGVRDPLLIAQIEEVEELVKQQVYDYYNEIPREDYQINFVNYGLNGVLGELEPTPRAGHELGIMFEVIAATQDLANAVCSSVRSTFLHYGYKGRKSTAGNLAFPFAPSDVPFGAVYEFSVYHLMEVADGLTMFPCEYVEV